MQVTESEGSNISQLGLQVGLIMHMPWATPWHKRMQ